MKVGDLIKLTDYLDYENGSVGYVKRNLGCIFGQEFGEYFDCTIYLKYGLKKEITFASIKEDEYFSIIKGNK